MSPREIAEDLDYVRTLAEEGRQAPLLGGSFLMFWGLLNAIAWALQWGLVNKLLTPNPGWHFAALWISYGVAAGIGSSMLGARVRALPGRSSLGNRVEGAVWAGAGIGTGAVVVGAIGHMMLGGGSTAPDVIVPAAYALYGCALMVTSIVSKEKWLGWFAGASFAAAAILGLFLSEHWFYLAGAVGSLTTLLTPGIVLLRKEPSTTV
ncbi:MAG: hypothetical protein IV086_01425 [Hyphomonadaceae bacterium]|nr:MAG: hypothetical protein FD160_3060 [Caulobacteraceae bacterium]MBT9444338.1 hypothetical protein [Hyphomonadaceae bacterium]TPW06078.1 MAG: hypothetical protein FD124_1892 [Alphaproteobacteria bacterium]